MKQQIKKTILKNGITILSDYMPHAYSSAVGVWIPRGSRHEKKDEYGLSHFYEHLVFKGTQNRSALDIARAIEDKGGILEAYTTRQETGFYAQVETKEISSAIDVISDMLMYPSMNKKEMEKERQVIIEEIHSYEDIPEESVGDIFNSIHFKNCGLAHAITGNTSQVKKLTHAQMLKYKQQVIEEIPLYVCATGRVEHNLLVELCSKHFEQKKFNNMLPFDSYNANSGIKVVQKKDINQSNLFWGISFGKEFLNERARFALSIFNVVMGSGMSSRLFQKIREEKGLAYSVYSTTDVYKDCADWGVSLATDPRNLKKAFDLSLKEVQRFFKNGFQKEELNRTKASILGGLHLGADSPEKRINRLAEQILHLGEFHSMEQVEKTLNSITEDDVLEVVNGVFKNAKFSVALIEPQSKNKTVLDIDF